MGKEGMVAETCARAHYTHTHAHVCAYIYIYKLYPEQWKSGECLGRLNHSTICDYLLASSDLSTTFEKKTRRIDLADVYIDICLG